MNQPLQQAPTAILATRDIKVLSAAAAAERRPSAAEHIAQNLSRAVQEFSE